MKGMMRMINRACISINNRCNLNCTYCHFHAPEKTAHLTESEMDIYAVLDNIMNHIDKHEIKVFKLGFVGNGEPLLDFENLKGYIKHIESFLSDGRIAAYTITNGTLVTKEMLEFFKTYSINIGFSIDGIPDIHNRYRCGTHTAVMKSIELYHTVNGHYPFMNCTVSRDVLDRTDEAIAFFEPFGTRITFSRMIGENGIELDDFHKFLEKAKEKLYVRTGGYDCTMYGGKCGAGINNIFYANGKIYICGNCVDLPDHYSSDTPLDEVKFIIKPFDRSYCYKEELKWKTKKE